MPQKKGKEEVGIMPTSKKNAGPHFIEIPGLVQDHFIVPILGVTPLILGKVPDGSKHQLITTQFAGRFRKGVKRPKPLNPQGHLPARLPHLRTQEVHRRSG